MFKLTYKDDFYIETYHFKSLVALLEFIELNFFGDDEHGILEISKD